MGQEFTNLRADAAKQAMGYTGESLTGPDGKAYTSGGPFHAADAFSIAAAGLEMTEHGFPDRTILSVSITRSQFAQPPLSWRRQYLTRNSSPAQRMLIAWVSTDDPLYYSFVLVFHQTPGPTG